MRMIVATAVAALMGISACTTMRNARDRIVRAPATCQDMSIPIYFEPDAAQVTPDGRRLIAAQAAEARRCKVRGVRVVGLADATGDPAANLELSKARAASVTDALMKAGLPPADFDLSAVGQAGSVTADGNIQPVRRRVDITLRLGKPARP